MQIREATEQDIPEILDVLKASLGQTSSKKTQEVWRYKHIDNPFGKSLVLIAEEDQKIIGVRAFMRWQWQKGEKIYSAFRAVDTATHPKHQGKGVFKKLTLKAIELGKEGGDHFVFNTPNTQSKPGYLKMGWEEVGKLNVSVKLAFYWRSKDFTYKHIIKDNGLHEEVFNELQTQNKESGHLFTPKNAAYLNWRYKFCKLQDYMIYEDGALFIASYLKKRKKIRELRISEIIALPLAKKEKARKAIARMAKITGANMVTAAPGLMKNGITVPIGPVLTKKQLNLSEVEEIDFQELTMWNYSLGDLELF